MKQRRGRGSCFWHSGLAGRVERLGQTTNQGAVMQDRPAGTAPGARSTPLGDAEFVRRAAIANRFEIEEAQLALAQGGDPRLKEFARTMVMDHGVALKDLETAARMAGVTVPDRKLDEAHQAKNQRHLAQEGRRLRPAIPRRPAAGPRRGDRAPGRLPAERQERAAQGLGDQDAAGGAPAP